MKLIQGDNDIDILSEDSAIIIRSDGTKEAILATETSEESEENVHIYNSAFIVLAIINFINDEELLQQKIDEVVNSLEQQD